MIKQRKLFTLYIALLRLPTLFYLLLTLKNKNVKKLTLSLTISILTLTYISAQQTSESQATIPLTESNNRNIVLKTNLFSPIGLSLELGLSKHFAIGSNFTYFPTTELGDVTKSWGRIEFTEASKGFGFEANYYPSGSKLAPRGFYIGGFVQYRSANVIIEKLYIGTNEGGATRTTVKGNLKTSLMQYGGQLGFQTIAKFGFTFNIGVGIGYHKIKGVPDLLPDNSETDNKFLKTLNNNYKGFGARPMLSLGWAF